MLYEDYLQQYVGDLELFQILVVVFVGMASFPNKDPIADNYIEGYQEH